jgi:hypothetical protein
VVRGAVGGVVHNSGEGTGKLQSFGSASDVLINDVWIDHSKKNIQDAK